MKVKSIVINGIIAALYIAVTMLVQSFGYNAIQFRLSEMFNHLVVFNKKYMIGIVLGVFIANLFSPLGMYDLAFGVGQSILSLAITIWSARFIKGQATRMIFNTIVFTIMMFLIAIEIQLVGDIPFALKPFLLTWLTCAAGEFAVMAVGIPVMMLLNKRLHFNKLIEE